MKNLLLLFFAIGITLLISCGEGNVVVIQDPQIQRNADIEIIEDFLADKGYTNDQIDTTASGVRYVILDEGQTQYDSLKIEESDIIKYDYIGRLTNDKLFDTTIESIAVEDTVVYSETRNYSPLVMTYSSTGWWIDGRGFVNGFSDGITGSFGKLHIGGRVLIVIPSDLAYGPRALANNDGVETVPANSVITFELLPIAIKKQ
ncbi:MAG: FKBP-type peptidyl-prolyl cis-trans isomerase [Cyclobacteriaceae bacterium]